MSKLFLGIVLASTAIWSVPESSADAFRDARVGVSECELAKEWVEANLDALPKTLGAFSEHSVTFRRAIYGELDTEARVSLWRQNLVAVADGATISPERRLYLQELSGRLDGYLRDSTPRSELDALTEEARAILGGDLALRAIGMLGPVPEATPAVTDCSCSTRSDWCPLSSGGTSICFGGGCRRVLFCGTLWLRVCDGKCKQVIMH